jgi:hypothetical protein
MKLRISFVNIMIITVLIFCISSSFIAADEDNKGIEKLLLIVKVFRESDIEFLNSLLKTDDIFFTYGVKPKLLRRINGPKIMITRGSVMAIKKELAKLHNIRNLRNVSIDYVNYNPEHWKEAHTPKKETENLPLAVREVRKLANEINARLSFVTDHVLLERWGREIAPLVDLFGIQMQRYQRDPLEEFRREAVGQARIVRAGNRDVPIVFQLSLSPPKWKVITTPDGRKKRVYVRDKTGRKVEETVKVEVVLEQIKAIRDIADGIAIIYTEEARNNMRKLIYLLRR